MPDDPVSGNAHPTPPGEKSRDADPKRSRWVNFFPTAVPAIIVAVLTVASMWAMRSCDDTDELLRENMDLRFNLVDEKFKGLNESIDQVRSELSDFKASYEERVRYLERERMEAANLEAAENVDIAEVDEQRPRVATSQ